MGNKKYYYKNNKNNYQYFRKKKKADVEKKYTYDDLLMMNKETNTIELVEPVIKKKFYLKHPGLSWGLGVVVCLVILFSTSYAFFSYTEEDSRETVITTGEVYVRTNPTTVSLATTKVYPRTVSEARSQADNYIDFTILGKNTSTTNDVKYWITPTNGNDLSGKTRINNNYLRFDLSSLDVNDNETLILNNISYDTFMSQTSLGTIPINTTSEISQKYRIRMWIDENILISDTENNANYTQNEFKNLFASIKIIVNSKDVIRDGIS